MAFDKNLSTDEEYINELEFGTGRKLWGGGIEIACIASGLDLARWHGHVDVA